MNQTVRIGTRGSKLALWQSEWVKAAILEQFPSLSVDLVVIKTKGDKILDVPLADLGGKGLFVKEIEQALLENRVDLAVHSMKDMPSVLLDGLVIGPIPEREHPADVLISRKALTFDDLPAGARIGTGSLRRASQLKHARPDLTVVPLRGNLDTRLKKLETGVDDLDAVVLAAAGVRRLGLEEKITERLDFSVMLPAVGQGALCIETRSQDTEMAQVLDALDHMPTRQAVLGERAFLNRLEGSCQVPIAGFGKVAGDGIILEGLVADLEGRKVVRGSRSGPAERSEQLGVALAEDLLSKGADKILQALQHQLK
jgi:hydroxymethylbilane synthase